MFLVAALYHRYGQRLDIIGLSNSLFAPTNHFPFMFSEWRTGATRVDNDFRLDGTA
jgi:hypothetical protein